MSLNTVVAIRGDFDARFPDLRSLSPGQDRVPGRDLAECVLGGLRRHGIAVEGPFDEEPFFALRCRVADRRIEILCYICIPSVPVWVVEVGRTPGLLARILGRNDDARLAALADAVHDALLHDGRVRDMRWFASLPDDPFGDVSFSTHPTAG